MRVGSRALKNFSIGVGCLSLALQVGLAQKKPASSSNEGARTTLVDKARALESRGRPDMAVQLWQQILLSDPNNPEALAGLAKDYKLMGAADKANEALDHLRRANPNDPNIARIESLSSTKSQSDQLRQAGELARQGRADDAMRIYRQLYGDHPPEGEIAEAYYQTLFGTATGKAEAIAGMRALASRNPGDEHAAVALGTMLTYDGKTRPEGVRILEAHPHNPEAQAALRQALIWDSANPASAAELRQYLKAHPQDTEVAGNLRTNETKLALMNSGIARTPAERAAFAALNAHRLDDAEKRFEELLRKDPNNGRVDAGMGFLRMQQKNFPAAISFLDQAEQNGYKARPVESALATSRFWAAMSEATQAMDEGHLDIATAKFKAALVMNPRSPEALNGLAGLLTKEQQYPAAAGVYEQLIKVQPTNLDGWRGLFLAYARDNQNRKALATVDHYPARVRLALEKDPEYLRSLAIIYQADGRIADAQRVLVQALALPFPDNGGTLKTDTKLQYAGILMAAKRYDQAAALYTQILSENQSNVSAWMGLISAHHELGQDTLAISDVEKMPPPTYEAALADSGFLSMLGAIYQQANQFEVAQGLLERAVRLQTASGGQPSIAVQLQLAGIYLQRNNTAAAYEIYNRILKASPDRADAWKGLISTLLATNRNAEALQEIALIPAPVRKQLESDIEFEQAEASVYAATGDLPHAAEYMNRVQAHYAKLKTLPPANIDVQNAWLLYNTGNERALYPALMRLGGRSDLTVTQRETVQTIWANWSVRRAAAAMENGNVHRAVDILDAAAQAFPDNVTVRTAVAGGFARVGRAKESVALYKNIPMENATSGDYQGAIGAALAANDRNQAELWLRQALERFPHDAAVLSLAARYEQLRGENQRAAEYWRAALAVMPAASPTDKLAHELVYPEQDLKPHRAVTAADLQQLLDPENEPFPKTAKVPPLPAYGADPYNGQAPVVPLRPQAYVQSLTPSGSSAWVVRDALYHPQIAILSSTPLLAQAQYPAPPINPNAPHSMASDAWKGLVFSLMAGNRNAEALQTLDKIPPDIRRQLDADIEFVQGVASLYVAAGDVARAGDYLNRVENYYLIHHMAAPAGIEIQHAWLLYNVKDEIGLYPVLSSLDARSDLTADQRTQIDSLWATWAVRRAEAALNEGNTPRGVQILQAASHDYPDNLDIRKAVAGAYARIGRPADAVALFKTFPMENASAADYQAAISAALGARDMAQAETWLRQALGRFPSDPLILGEAARFEQARGNSQRAADYWRAALAAMPPAAATPSLDSGFASPAGNYPPPAAGDTKRLLDPRHEPQASRLPPLPAYPSASAATVPQNFSAPSSNPLPAPDGVNLRPIPNTNATAPIYTPQSQREGTSVAQPVLVQQSWIQPFMPQLTVRSAKKKRHVQRSTAAHRPPARAGIVKLPPSEQTIDSIDSAQSLPLVAPAPPLRLSSQPMDVFAAQVQARFAAETDSQLTQGFAPVVRPLSNAPVNPPSNVAATPRAATAGQYTAAQYTPSAQEAATGAYSVPRKPAADTSSAPAQSAASKPTAYTSKKQRRSKTRRAATSPSEGSGEPAAPSTLGNAPAQSNTPPTPPATLAQAPGEVPYDNQAQNPAPASPGGLSDQDLEQRNLPPLRGPWVRVQRQPNPVSPREEAEMQLRSIESGYSAWMGGAGLINYRSGALGFDHLSALEAPFEASAPLGYNGRVTIVARPVFLDSGQADGQATIQVLQSSTGGNKLVSIPEPIGDLTATDVTPPAQQNAVGIGGELQLAFPHAAIAGGYTPAGFLVSTFTARGMFRPGNGPITLNVSRDSVKDSQLSYAGLRDPAGNALGHQGQIWGGVVSNQGNVQYAHGDAMSGFYVGAGGQYLTGYNVPNNTRIDGNAGAYWRLMTSPEYGNLSIGVNFFAMRYDNNQNAFTHGMGGYFSPQGYFLANVPFSFAGHYLTNWHYNVMGGLGVQAFQEDKTNLWPLAGDKAIEAGQNNPMLPDHTSVGPNFDFRAQTAYQISPHWFAGGFLSANNSRNYTSVSAGFSVHYMFRAQPSTASGPTGIFPTDGLRPFTVP